MNCSKGNLIDSFTYDNGNAIKYIDRLYEDFYREFVETPIYYKGRKILMEDTLSKDGKLDRFWHLISEGEIEELREPIPERAKRLHWIYDIITSDDCQNECDNFYYYEYVDKNKTTAYLICVQLKYLIVLRKMKYVYYLKTAFPINDNKIKRHVLRAIEYRKENEL